MKTNKHPPGTLARDPTGLIVRCSYTADAAANVTVAAAAAAAAATAAAHRGDDEDKVVGQRA
eukprot:5530698-Pleurochrysis_carterae.AAC.1